MDIWQSPLPLLSPHGLWMSPMVVCMKILSLGYMRFDGKKNLATLPSSSSAFLASRAHRGSKATLNFISVLFWPLLVHSLLAIAALVIMTLLPWISDRGTWITLTIFAIQTLIVTGSSNSMPCQSTKLVVYKVTFSTFWDRKKFPKQYPEFRPPAQWSKLIGKIFVQYHARNLNS